jgi:hypothetical protein
MAVTAIQPRQPWARKGQGKHDSSRSTFRNFKSLHSWCSVQGSRHMILWPARASWHCGSTRSTATSLFWSSGASTSWAAGSHTCPFFVERTSS